MRLILKILCWILIIGCLAGAWIGNLADAIGSNAILFAIIGVAVFTLWRLRKTNEYEEGWTRGTRFANKAHREIFRRDRERSRRWHASHR